MKTTQELQNEILFLQKENKYLKSLLEQAGISYEADADQEREGVYDPNQGARIVHREITPQDANLFFGMF